MKEELSQLQSRLKELSSYAEKVDQNLSQVRTVKEERSKEVVNAVDLMIGRLDAQWKVKLMTLMRQKQFLGKETEQLEKLLQEIDYQVENSSPSQLINKSSELLMTIMQAQLKSAKNYVFTQVSSDFSSELVPTYDTCTFLIERFTFLQLEGLAVYSKSLFVNGLCWRLKVYPCGNGPARGEYLSVFLELSSGPSGSSKYEYRVQMLHSNPEKEISREFVSDFEIGECWGYNRFFPLDLLASEGYLDSERDTLELRFQVRPSTYYQKCRDQQWYILELLKTHQQQAAEISNLKEQLDREKKQNVLLQSKPPQIDTQCLVPTTPANGFGRGDFDFTAGPQSLPPRSDRSFLMNRRSFSRPDPSTNERIFSEILKCLSPGGGESRKHGLLHSQTSDTSTASNSSSTPSSPAKNDLQNSSSNHSIDMALLTASTSSSSSLDEEGGVLGAVGETPAVIGKFKADSCSEALARHIRSLGGLSLRAGSSESDNEANSNHASDHLCGAVGGEDGNENETDEMTNNTENLIEYSELVVPSRKPSMDPVSENAVLLNLLEDLPSTSAAQAMPKAYNDRSGVKSE